MLKIVQVSTDAHIEAVRDILDEYIKWIHTMKLWDLSVYRLWKISRIS